MFCRRVWPIMGKDSVIIVTEAASPDTKKTLFDRSEEK